MSINLNSSIGSHRIEPTNKVVNTPKLDESSNNNQVNQNTSLRKSSETNLTTNRQSITEIKNEVDNTINALDNRQLQEINNRASRLIANDNINRNENNNDDLVLSRTQDDVKVKPLPDPSKDMADMMRADISLLVKSMDSTLNKAPTYKKAEELGKNFLEGLDPKSSLRTHIDLMSKDELKETVTKSVFGIKEKYAPAYEQAKAKFERKKEVIKELQVLRTRSYEINGTVTPQEKQEARTAYLSLLKDSFPDVYKLYKKEESKGKDTLPSMRTFDKLNKKPELYDFLPENKQKLVDKIMNGIEKSNPDNRVTSFQNISLNRQNDTFTPNTLSNSDSEKLKEALKITGGSKGMIEPTISIPTEINFQGKTYTYEKFLGGGGDGIAFSMKSTDNERVVLKAQVKDPEGSANYNPEEGNDTFRAELKPHLHALSDGKNDNILDLKGVVKRGNEIFSITEYAKGGEMDGVVEKIDNNNEISANIKDLLKTSMLKDALTGLQHLHTEMNMTHYDVKPGNFFVGESGKAKVADFGRSKIGHDQEQLISTPGYRAPEASLEGSEKIDIFAMGLSIGKVLKNDNPYLNEQTANDFSHGTITKMYEGNTKLDNLLNKMTSFNKDERPTFTAVLEHSVFNNSTLNNPEVKGKLENLIKAVINNDENSIRELNQELKQHIA